jgi:hypothetical protein
MNIDNNEIILKYKITDIIGQEASVKFSDVSTFSKTEYTDDDDIDADENSCQLEVVYHNSRRTRLICSLDEYKRFCNAYDKYILWLQKNPSLERNRFDMAVLDRIIKDNVEMITRSALDVNTKVQSGLIEMNEKMAQNIIESDKLISNKTQRKLEEIEEQLVHLQTAISTVQRFADVVNHLVPEKEVTKREQLKVQKEKIKETIKED